MDNPDITKKEQRIILERLEASDPSIKLAVSTPAGVVVYSRSDIIRHVTNLDEVGLQYVKEQMDFTRALLNGEIHGLLAEIPDEDVCGQ